MLNAGFLWASERFTAPTIGIETGLGHTAIEMVASGGIGRIQFYDDGPDFGGQIGAISGENLGVSAVEALILSGNSITLNAAEHGFFSATPIAKPTVSGSRGGNAALGSALTALANLGLITNSST